MSMPVNEVLCYITYALRSSSLENTRPLILHFYDEEEISDAKIRLYQDFAEHLGDPPSRTRSAKRSKAEADLGDILDGLTKLDMAKVPEPQYAAHSLRRLPKILPEEMPNSYAIAEKVKLLEEKINLMEAMLVSAAELTSNDNTMKNANTNKDKDTPQSCSHKPTVTHTQPLHRNKTSYANAVQSRPRKMAASQPVICTTPLMDGSVANDSSSSDDDQSENHFMIPTAHARRERRRTQNNQRRNRKFLEGMATPNDSSNEDGGLRGAPRPSRDFFIYRVEKDTSEEDIKRHLEKKGVSFRKIIKISHAEALFASFKVTVCVSITEQIMQPSLWPVGIRVRRFFRKENTVNSA